MKILPGKILIKTDLDQKQTYNFPDGSTFYLPPSRHEYEQNGRETNPVLATVQNGKLAVKVVVLHHNLAMDKAYQIGNETGVSVIPDDRWIMAVVENGELTPINDNLICARIVKPNDSPFYNPVKSYYEDRVEVIASDVDGIEVGDIVFILKWADYEVVYHTNNEIVRRIVLWGEDVIGIKHNNDMKPLHDNVLVLPDETETTKNGFIVPDSDQEKAKVGTVVAVGPGRHAKQTGNFVPTTVKEGERVYYGKYTGTETVIDGKLHLIMTEEHILGIEDGISHNDILSSGKSFLKNKLIQVFDDTLSEEEDEDSYIFKFRGVYGLESVEGTLKFHKKEEQFHVDMVNSNGETLRIN